MSFSQVKAFTFGATKGSLMGFVFYVFIMTLINASASPGNYYEVFVKYRAGGCTQTEKVIVQAPSLGDAKRRAQTIVQLGIETSISKVSKLQNNR